MPLAEVQNIFFIPVPGSGKGKMGAARTEISGDSIADFPVGNVFIGDSSNEPVRSFFDSAWTSPEFAWPAFCSPFVLYGPTGCGKSSLAAAIVSQFFRTGSRSLSWTGPDLVRHVAAAIDSQTTDQLLCQMELAAVVCIDDLHWLENHDAAQEFTIAALDRLQEREVPVVVTLPDSPEQISGLRPTLTSRLKAGLTIPVRLPGMRVRCEILTRQAEQHQLAIDPLVIEMLARRFPVAASLLVRIVNTIAAQRLQNGHDLPDDDEVVSMIVRSACDNPDFPRRLVEAVAGETGVKPRDIYGTSRQLTTVLARGIVIHLLRNTAKWNFSRIGKLLRGKDHSTILHSSRKIAGRIESDPAFAELMQKFEIAAGEIMAMCLPDKFAHGVSDVYGKAVESLSASVSGKGGC